MKIRDKLRGIKQKHLRRCLIASALVMSIFAGSKILYAATIDAQLSGIQAELMSSGTSPFNDKDGDGYDSNATNNIIRTYDEATYDFTLGLNGTDPSKTYDVEVVAKLPDVNESNRLKIRWLSSNFSASDVSTSKQGSEMKFYIRNLRPGQIYTKSLIMQVKSMEDGDVIKPEFTARIVGDFPGNEINGSANKDLVVTAKTNLDVHIKSSSTMTMQNVDGKLGRVVPFAFDIKSKGDPASNGKGNAFPSGDIELIMDLTTTKVNTSTKEETPVDLDTKAIQNLAIVTNDKFGNQIRIDSGIGSGSTTDNPTQIENSGKFEFTEIAPNKYRVLIKDYTIGNHFPSLYWGTTFKPGDTYRAWTESYKYFTSQTFEIFVPLIEDKDASYDIRTKVKVDKVNFTDSKGKHDMDIDTANNEKTVIVPDYLPGSYWMNNYTSDEKDVGIDRPIWTGQNARILASGQKFHIRPYLSFEGHTSPLEGIKGGVTMTTFFEGDKVRVRDNASYFLSNANHNPVKKYDDWYGVGKLTRAQIVDNATPESALTWYETLEEAKKHEDPSKGIFIYGYKADTHDNVYATGGPQLYSLIRVETRVGNVKPFETAVSKARATVYLDEERTKSVEVKRDYIPAEYDKNGDIVQGTQIPSRSSGGSTIQFIPYESNVNTVTKTLEDNQQTVFDLAKGNEIKWEVSPSINGLGNNSTTDEITVTHTIPKGESYKDGSANIKPSEVKKLDDGSTKIMWKFNGYDPGVGIPKVTFITSVPITTEDRTRLEHKTIIEAPGDIRSEKEFRTDIDTITIVNDASMRINKTVSKNIVELNEEFEYTVTLANNGKRDYSEGNVIDVLPYNGDNTKSNFHGNYDVTNIETPEGVDVEYTTQDPKTINRDPNNSGVTTWVKYNKGQGNVKATAIRMHYDKVASNTEYPVKVKIKPTGNQRNDIYLNQAHGSVVGLEFSIYSNILKTEVIARDITGSVWYDQNNNGLNNTDEQQLDAIKVNLLDKDNKVLKSTQTDSSGKYIFRDILPGEYKVRFGEDEGGLKPTQVISPPKDNSNHILSRTLVSSPFMLTSTDKVKIMNLGVVNGVKLEKNVDKLIANIGESVTYKLKAINKGGFKVADTTVTDNLPDEIDVVSGTISDGGVYNKEEHKIVWKIKDLASDASKEVSFDAVIKKGAAGKIENIASVKPYHKVPESPSNTTELVILSYHKSSSVPTDTVMKPGQELTYSIDINNESAVEAKDVLVEDNIPNGTQLVEGSISDSGSKSLLIDKISWSVNVPAKSKKTVTFKVKALKPDSDIKEVRNVAVVNGNSTNETLNKIGKSKVTLEKSVDKTKVRENETITYNIKVSNTGTVESENINLTDIIPAGSSLVSGTITEGGTVNHSTITWNLGKLNAKSSETVSFKVTSNNLANDVLTYDIINQASLHEVGLDNIMSNKVVTTVNKPKLDISKTANKSERVTVGSELEYSIRVRNSGTASQMSTVIEDTLPSNTELVQGSIDNSGVFDKGKIKWTLGELNPGSEKIVKFKVKVLNNGDNLIWNLSNKATVNGKDTNTVTNEVGIPKLKYSKQVNLDKATEGDILTYTINVTNEGKYSSYNVEVRDTVPKGTELIDGQKTTWTIPELAEGKSQSVSFKVKVLKLPADVTELNIPNRALVNNKETNEVNTLVQIPRLEFHKESSVASDKKLNVGDSIDYRIVIRNTGSASAMNINVEDVIPEGTELKSKGEASKSLFTDKLNWVVNELKPGDTKTLNFSVTTKDMSSENKTLWNVNNTAKVNNINTNEVTNKVAVPKLNINKAVDKSLVREGEELTYTITISNKGSIDSANVSVEDNLPQGVELVKDSANEGGVYNNSVRSLKWSIATLKEGETKKLTFKAKVKDLEGNLLHSIIENKAILKEKSEIESNQVATEVKKPRLEIKKDSYYDAMNLTVGDIITYSITVKNTGTLDQPLVEVRDTLDEGLKYVEGSANEGGTFNETSKALEWNTNKLEPNQTKTYTFKAKIKPNSDESKISWIINNSATVNGKDTNNVEEQIGIPNIAIEKFVNRNDLLTLGEYLQYDIRVTNTGSRTARDIEVRDTLPKQVDYVNASEEPNVVDKKEIYWNVRNLAPGESKTIHLQVKTVDLNGFKDTFTNKALAKLKDPGANKIVNSNEVKNNIAIPNLVTRKKSITEKDGTLSEGDKIKYAIEVENTGSYVAKNVKINDSVPKGLTLVKGNTDASIGDIKPGETKEIEFETSIDKFEEGVYTKEFVNKAKVSSSTQNLETNQVSNLAQKGELRFSKTSNVEYDSEVLEGQEIEYTINVSNIGDAPLGDITIKDSIPKGTTLVSSDGANKDNNLEWNIKEIKPKQGLQFKLRVKVNVLTGDKVKSVIENTATVNGNKTNTIIHHVVKPKLVSVKYAEQPGNSVVLAGDEIKYNILIRNIGSTDAHKVEVKDLVPDGTTLVKDSIDSKGVYDEASRTIIWNIDSVSKNDMGSKVVSFKVKVNEGEDRNISNIALVNNEPTNEIIHYVKHERLDFIKSVDKEIEVSVGDTLSYKINVTNNGTVPMKDIVIEDTIPEHTKLVKILNNGSSGDNKKLLWTLDKLDIGESKEVCFEVEVRRDTKDKTEITNTALVNEMKTNTVKTLVLRKEPDAPPLEELDKPKPPKPPIVSDEESGHGSVEFIGDSIEDIKDAIKDKVDNVNDKINNTLDKGITNVIEGINKIDGVEKITNKLPATGTIRTVVKGSLFVVLTSGLIYVVRGRRG
ncbi:hypothetical protein UT300012_22620 [Paraclostridium bifermentans]